MPRVARVLIDAVALCAVAAVFLVALDPPWLPAPRVAGAQAAQAAQSDGEENGGEVGPERAEQGRVHTAERGRGEPAPGLIREHIIAHGTEETGAFNLVTAIYLGYRAYDTLGETIVLLLSVSGIAYLVGAKR
jgi:hypothetical protein